MFTDKVHFQKAFDNYNPHTNGFQCDYFKTTPFTPFHCTKMVVNLCGFSLTGHTKPLFVHSHGYLYRKFQLRLAKTDLLINEKMPMCFRRDKERLSRGRNKVS